MSENWTIIIAATICGLFVLTFSGLLLWYFITATDSEPALTQEARPTPTPMVSPESMWRSVLGTVGTEIWPGGSFKCEVEDVEGACVAHDQEEKAHIFFRVDTTLNSASSIMVSEGGELNLLTDEPLEDHIYSCSYSDYTRLHLGDCTSELLPVGAGVSRFYYSLEQVWPKLYRRTQMR